MTDEERKEIQECAEQLENMMAEWGEPNYSEHWHCIQCLDVIKRLRALTPSAS